MAIEYYLKEDASGHYQLEDGSGSLLLESSFKTGAAAINEAADTAAGVGTDTVSGLATIAETADTAAGVGTDTVSGIAALSELADVAAGVGTNSVFALASMAEDADLASGVGLDSVSTVAAILEAADAVSALGTHTLPVSNSGGFATMYERQVSRSRTRKHREERLADEAQQTPDPIQQELAHYLHEQLAKQAELDDLQRLKTLVAKQALDRELPEKVQAAYLKAQSDASFSHLQALQREYLKMLDEEEHALLMTLALLDD